MMRASYVAAVLICLGGFTGTAARAADYAPLDCTRAKAAAERTICGNYALGQSEARMATLFSVATALVPMGQRGDIVDAQNAFLKTRAACGRDLGCLKKTYAARIARLDAIIAAIASRGPY